MTAPNTAPRTYTDDEKRAIVEAICAKVADGGVGNTFSAAAAAAGVTRSTLYRWISENKQLQQLWAEARIWQAHATAEDAIELADSATKDNAHAVRIQVDARKWYTSKIAPKLYGDRLELTGANGIPLMPAPSTRMDYSRISMEELETLARLTAAVTVAVIPSGESNTESDPEDRADVAAARKALAEAGERIAWETAKDQLSLTSGGSANDGR